MNPTIVNFIIRICFFTGVLFGLHILILDYLEFALFDNKIVLAYLVNLFLAILIFCLLFIFKKKFKDQLGFIFVLGSMVKFALFFLLFYGSYYEDGSIQRQEFFAFFAPYILTLVIEVFSLSKWLNKLE